MPSIILIASLFLATMLSANSASFANPSATEYSLRSQNAENLFQSPTRILSGHWLWLIS